MPRCQSILSGVFFTLLVLALLHAAPVQSEPQLFDSDCRSLDDWEFLDLKGGGKAFVDEDPTSPSGSGPESIHLQGDEALLLARGVRLAEGTVLALWKDPHPKDLDADGVLVFGADYPDDLTLARNTRDRREHFLIEQDSDRGFQIKHQKAGADAEPLVELLGQGLTDDDRWNRSGWIWQKVHLGEGKVRAKYWSAAHAEPEGWMLEHPLPEGAEGRVGIKVWSGKAVLARFIVSQEDIVVPPPILDLALSRNILFIDSGEESSSPEFRVFVNLPGPSQLTLKLEGELSHQTEGGGHSFEAPVQLHDGATSLEISLTEVSESFRAALEKLPRTPGVVEVALRLVNAEGTNVAAASRTFEFRTADQYRGRFESIRQRAAQSILESESAVSNEALEATAALSLLSLAEENLAEADFESVDRSLEYAEEALDPSVRLAAARFESIEPPAANLVMGGSYTLTVPWRLLSDPPSAPWTARLEITDDLRVVTPIRVEAALPVEGWRDGGAVTKLSFKISPEFPPGSSEPIHRPDVREGFHRLFLSLWDEAGNAVWLDNPGADHAGNFSHRYEVGRLYVTPLPIEASAPALVTGDLPHTYGLVARFQHRGEDPMNATVRVSFLSEGGFEAFDFPAKEVALSPGQTTEVVWTPREARIAGSLTARIRIDLPEGFQVHAESRIKIGEPHAGLRVEKMNRTIEREGRFFNRIRLTAGDEAPKETFHVRAYTDDRLIHAFDWDVSESPVLDVDLEPSLGFHVLHIQQPGLPAVERRLIASTWETRDGRLLLNGEPFYVKGVNCHGMIPQSPERTRLMMRVLKGMGFNMLRGDYPPPWQLDAAQEENLGWMVLAPFSVTNTDVLKDRHTPHPMKRMREITRRFIPHYVGHPATWFWNNFNEVTGETDDMLSMFYPIYKSMDPVRRPIVYANLTGQDRANGQDVMGINYYYRPYTPIEELKVLIHGSQEFARKAGIPVIYCEFNNWFGPVYTEGARAVNEMFAAELSPEHPGGFFYQLREDGDRHPGVVFNDDTVWTNPTLERAFRNAFADLELSGEAQGGAVPIANKRPFTLRRMTYEVWSGPIRLAGGSLPDLPPNGAGEIPLPALDEEGGNGPLSVKVRFETHHGLRCEVVGEVSAR